MCNKGVLKPRGFDNESEQGVTDSLSKCNLGKTLSLLAVSII